MSLYACSTLLLLGYKLLTWHKTTDTMALVAQTQTIIPVSRYLETYHIWFVTSDIHSCINSENLTLLRLFALTIEHPFCKRYQELVEKNSFQTNIHNKFTLYHQHSRRCTPAAEWIYYACHFNIWFQFQFNGHFHAAQGLISKWWKTIACLSNVQSCQWSSVSPNNGHPSVCLVDRWLELNRPTALYPPLPPTNPQLYYSTN